MLVEEARRGHHQKVAPPEFKVKLVLEESTAIQMSHSRRADLYPALSLGFLIRKE